MGPSAPFPFQNVRRIRLKLCPIGPCAGWMDRMHTSLQAGAFEHE